MITRTWAYGTTHRGRVLESGLMPIAGVLIQTIEDLTDAREGHVLFGTGDPQASVGEEGTLTFIQGGPEGGFWKFERDKHQICAHCHGAIEIGKQVLGAKGLAFHDWCERYASEIVP